MQGFVEFRWGKAGNSVSIMNKIMGNKVEMLKKIFGPKREEVTGRG
jgi:hypothetical protein